MQIYYSDWQMTLEEQKLLAALTQPLITAGWRMLEPRVQRPGDNVEQMSIALEYGQPRSTTLVLSFTVNELETAAQAYRNRIIHPEILEITEGQFIDNLSSVYTAFDIDRLGLKPLLKHLVNCGCALRLLDFSGENIVDRIIFELGTMRISANILRWQR